MRKQLPLFISVFIIGFTALSAQIVFLRELLVLFYGNELSLGVVLGCWLFWTGLGSLCLGRFADRFKKPALKLALLQTLLAFALIATLLAARSVKLFLNVSPGQILGYIPIFLASFFVLSIFCLLNGFLFSLGCKTFEKISAAAGSSDTRDRSSRGIGLVYIIEALGSVVGGLLTSLVLIRLLPPLVLIFLLAAINLAAGGSLLFIFSPRKRLRAGKIAWLLVAAAGVVFLGSGGIDYLQKISLSWQWRGFDLKKTENSIYGSLAVTGRERQFSLFENGILMFTRPDLFSAEESVHFAMLEHPQPKKVLLIGGGVGGSLEEILKYPSLEEVIYVELDPSIIRLTREFLPPGDEKFLLDPRVKIVYSDGRRFLQQQQEKYDVIIVNLPDPFTAQLNRFYTGEFFQLARKHLRPEGVLSLAVTSAENYISGELQNFLACIYLTLKDVFPEVVVLPGGSAFFLASPASNYLTADHRILEERIQERGLSLLYIREYYLFDRLRPERVEYLQQKITTASRAQVNLDFHPICYFYDMVFWSTYFMGESGGWFTRFLQKALILRWWWFLFPAGFALLLFPLLRSRRKKSSGAWVLWPVLTSGFSEIVFQLVILLAFQILYGYVYYKLGIILTLYMVGLVLGGGVITARLPHLKDEHRLFFLTQVVICLYPLLLPVIFFLLSGTRTPALNWLGENLVLPLLPVIAGFFGGFQVPLAGRIYLKRQNRVGMVSGLSYGFDLLGACLGALLISALVLPVLGVAVTCYAVTLLNLTSLIVIIAYRPSGR